MAIEREPKNMLVFTLCKSLTLFFVSSILILDLSDCVFTVACIIKSFSFLWVRNVYPNFNKRRPTLSYLPSLSSAIHFPSFLCISSIRLLISVPLSTVATRFIVYFFKFTTLPSSLRQALVLSLLSSSFYVLL